MSQGGLTSRITAGGLPILRIHYTADTNKDPATPEGAAWLQSAIQGYPRGSQDPAWRKEMEVEYGAMGGQLLFDPWETAYAPLVVCPPWPVESQPGVKFYGTYDHGWVHKSVYQVHAVLPDGRKYTVWEFAASRVPARAIAEIVKGNDVQLKEDGRHFAGNPYAGREVVRIADPQIFAKTGRQTDDPFESLADTYRQKYGVTFQRGTKGGEITVAQWLIGDLWLDAAQIKYQIFSTCTQLLYELPRLHYKKNDAMRQLGSKNAEQLVDKDNDAWDALCQFLRVFPVAVAPRTARNILGTFAWHQAKLKTRKPLPNTYARR